MGGPGDKLRGILRERHREVSLACAALLVWGVFLAGQAYAATERERVTQEKERWHEEAAFTYAVTVTRNATVWPLGTVLPMGEPSYYRTVTDRIPITFDWRAAGVDPLAGLAEGNLTLRVRAEASPDRPYWEITKPLAEAATDDVEAGLRLEGTLMLDELVEEVNGVVHDLPPGDARVNWSVEATVAYALTQNGRAEAEKVRYTFPIKLTDPRVILPAAEDVTWRPAHADTATALVERSAGWAGVFSALRAQALVVGGLAGLGLVAWARAADPGRGLDAREAAFRREHEANKEWVTTSRARVDTARLAGPMVDVDALEDLVVVAADARVRVVLDEARRVYYAILPTVTYRYARHQRGALRTPAVPARR